MPPNEHVHSTASFQNLVASTSIYSLSVARRLPNIFSRASREEEVRALAQSHDRTRAVPPPPPACRRRRGRSERDQDSERIEGERDGEPEGARRHARATASTARFGRAHFVFKKLANRNHNYAQKLRGGRGRTTSGDSAGRPSLGAPGPGGGHGSRLAVGETDILLHPPPPSAGVTTGMERGCQ